LAKRMQVSALVPKIIEQEVQRYRCTNIKYELHLVVEKAVVRLSEIGSLREEEAAYLLTNLLETSAALEDHYNYEFTEEKAGFNQDGELMLWINDNYFKNEPSVSSCINHRKDNREKIIRAVLLRCPSLQKMAGELPPKVVGRPGRIAHPERFGQQWSSCQLPDRKVVSVLRLEKQVPIQQSKMTEANLASRVSLSSSSTGK
jgi:hypothetical protein